MRGLFDAGVEVGVGGEGGMTFPVSLELIGKALQQNKGMNLINAI